MTADEGDQSTSNTDPQPPVQNDAARVATGFVVKLVVLTLLLGFGEAYLMQQSREGGEGEWLFRLRELVAWAGAALAGLFDARVKLDGVTLTGAGPALIVSVECTALFAKALYCAAAISYPARWRDRLIGCVLGVLGVAVLNVVRVAGLAVIASRAPWFFNFAHLVLMQWFLISCVAPLWLAWAVWTTKRAQKARA